MEKRSEQLDRAMEAFFRHGYRKASMKDIAEVIGISRQALYNHYSSKSILFAEAVRHAYAESERRACKALINENQPLQECIFCALDTWVGVYVEPLRLSPHATEIDYAAKREIPDIAEQTHKAIEKALNKTLRTTKGRNANDIAVTLMAAAKGLLNTAKDRSEFRKKLRTAVRIILCEPK
ncbi:TetR/AcrR family transcriptional regulator [Planctomycetota bacterium]|nr:TetR/AcrR family transcriptional regulator [Planctomycetota bacterium]